MTDQSDPTAKEPTVSDDNSTAVDLSKGHHLASGEPVPAQFTDPGLPAHIHRLGDLDDKAGKRSERQVATLFGLSMLATVLFIVAYFAVGRDRVADIPVIGRTNALHVSLGVCLGFSLLFIGLGAVHWAKTLMSDEEVVEERHVLRSDDDAREGALAILGDAAESAQIKRRPLVVYSLGGALGLFALPLVVQLVGSLGPLPHRDLETSLWDSKIDGRRRRLMRDPENTAIRLSDVTLGSVFHVLPEGIDQTAQPNNEKVKASVILISLEESDIKSAKERSWGIGGVVAFSKICTHVGCPVGLYEQQTHHLLCPCHQSTFDLTEDCKVIFGPAKRPLPQLKISVDDEGYLVADQGFGQPVGPSFWERA